jgi:hypothetical protein
MLSRSASWPSGQVFDNDASVVAAREHGRARLHREISSLLGSLSTRAIVLRPRRPTSKGQVERTIGYLETSFLPLRTFASLDDLQAQHDDWAARIAASRTLRRTGARVGDAAAVERGFLRPLPDPRPDVTLHFETRASIDGFVRVDTADYSVPPAFANRRVSVRLSARQVELFSEGASLYVHRRSFLATDVVLAPAHGRATRLAREAKDRLEGGRARGERCGLELRSSSPRGPSARYRASHL